MIAALLIILNLIILESLLSIDNAAVLATMVKDLPGDQSKKALKYGIWGAYIFRGLCLIFASYLVLFWPLKIAGGLYLLWLGVGHFTKANDTIEEASNTGDSKIFKFAQKYFKLSSFWATVILVEIMDLAFSIDNVFAAVAMTKNIWLIMVGVFIGILAMRFVAQKFIDILQKHPQLEASAFVVIILLGIKLSIAGICDWEYLQQSFSFILSLKHILDSHATELIFSGCMMLVLFTPLLMKKKDATNISTNP